MHKAIVLLTLLLAMCALATSVSAAIGGPGPTLTSVSSFNTVK